MQSAILQEMVPLVIRPGLRTQVALFAGGTSGLLLADPAGTHKAQWSVVAHRAEAKGFSCLLFALPLPPQGQVAGIAAAADLLRGLGVEQIVLVAAGDDTSLAVRAAAEGRYEALVLVDPDEAADPASINAWRAVRTPKLLVVGSDSQGGEDTARLLFRRAIGPIMVRHFPTDDAGAAMISGTCGELVVEAVTGFAARTCGIRSVEGGFEVAGGGRFQGGAFSQREPRRQETL